MSGKRGPFTIAEVIYNTAELARAHAWQHGLDHKDRPQHVGFNRGHPFGAAPIFEFSRRRPGIVVDQDIGFRRRRGQSVAAFIGIKIGPHRCHFDAGRLADFRGGVLQTLFVEPVDYDLAAFARQRGCAGLAQTAGGSANDRPAPFDPQIHSRPPRNPLKSRVAAISAN
jgi:hypothetical protein